MFAIRFTEIPQSQFRSTPEQRLPSALEYLGDFSPLYPREPIRGPQHTAIKYLFLSLYAFFLDGVVLHYHIIPANMATPLNNQAGVEEPGPAKEIVVEEGDIALQFAGEVIEVSPELISRVRWKIDLFVLPLLA